MMTLRWGTGIILSLATIVGLTYFISQSEPVNAQHDKSAVQATVAPEIAVHPEREAYFGDLHLHTGYSFDAFLFGTEVDPETAYRFARGDAVRFRGQLVQRGQPLDFLAVTDHAENLGVGPEVRKPNSDLAQGDFGQAALGLLRTFSQSGMKAEDQETTVHRMQALNASEVPPEVKAVSASAWQREIQAANRFYQPGRFTTLIGYEWTSDPKNQNLHRNVIFKGDTAPTPFSSKQSFNPRDLWLWLEKIRGQGFEAIAIPHNANASNGLMYDWTTLDGRPIDRAYAQLRQNNEPLTEIAQMKGASETHPLLSPNDEFASYETIDTLLGSKNKSKLEGSYYRDALSRGLVLQRKVGVNAYKDGVVGASDLHAGLSVSAPDEYAGDIASVNIGGVGPNKDQAAAILKGVFGAETGGVTILNSSPGNLTGVWAESNTRDAIYNALRRRETFATSGPRMKVRFFGGWNFRSDILSRRDWVKAAYQAGVPMGSDLSVKGQAQAPSFVVWALKDPNGANLDRIQIIKVWEDDGQQKERIFEIVWSGPRRLDNKTGKLVSVGNTVDLKTGKVTNSIGAVELKKVWRDPDFDPSQHAAYYVRVLEIPTPRWSTLLAVEKGVPLSDKVPATIQQRAWSSPIWYSAAH